MNSTFYTIFAAVAILCTVGARADEELHGTKLVEYLNSLPNMLWKAQEYPQFKGKSLDELKQYLGALQTPTNQQTGQVVYGPDGKNTVDEVNDDYGTLPTQFTASDAWPECADVIDLIQDQNRCGSCWAVSATSSFSDRLCIASHGKINISLSALDLMACCPYCGYGCSGGWPNLAFRFWQEKGVVTGNGNRDGGGCRPYPIGPCHLDPKTGDNICPAEGAVQPLLNKLRYEGFDCANKCAPKYTAEPYANDTYFGSTYIIYNRHNRKVMVDLIENGPLVAVFSVYEDFFNYKGGIYEQKSQMLAGGHAVRLVGWGEENGVPYWKVANSWTENWGEKGYFRIRRGTNECGFEEGFISGIPDVERSLAIKV